jgi:hypothetical protein
MAAKVVDVPELLEMILLQLPMQYLLLAQRTLRSFKATIEGSTKLQQALWFVATPAGERIGPSKPNPLIFQHERDWKRKNPGLGPSHKKRVGFHLSTSLANLAKTQPASSAFRMLIAQPLKSVHLNGRQFRQANTLRGYNVAVSAH